MSDMRHFGHQFRPMTQSDWNGFAGAEEDTLICYPGDDTALLWSESAGILTVVDAEGNETQFERRRV